MFNVCNNIENFDSYFAVLGLIRSGKSLFLNAISETNSCPVGNLGYSCTNRNQLVSFVFNGHRFYGIDTPGLGDDDTECNEENINNLRNLLCTYPKIKKILIIKKYNDLRLPLSIQKTIISLMDIFQDANFWKHFAVINTWANPHDESFNDYIKEKDTTYSDKFLNCNNLLDAMKKNFINYRICFLEEYYVCSKNIEKYRDIKQIFNQIKDEIKNTRQMFKNIEKSEIKERAKEIPNKNKHYIIEKYKTITCIDFSGKKTTFDEILEKKEVALENCQVVNIKEESLYIDDDDVKWFDVLSLGIARAARKTSKYYVYKVKIYKVGDKLIDGDRIFDRIEFR